MDSSCLLGFIVILLRGLLVICLAPSAVFAYLDPGSGSLLLSSIVALFASFVFFVKNLFYKLIAMPFGIKSLNMGKNKNCSIVFYCEGAQYYGTFKPILDALDSFSHPYMYYTSSLNDPALKRSEEIQDSHNMGEFVYIGEGNKAYSFLNALRADIFVLTTPGLDVLHIKRNRGVGHYCHVVHSLSPMTYRVFGVDYFDSVLVANEVQRDFVRNIESAHNIKPKHIAITGSTYLDELSVIKDSIPPVQQSTNTESKVPTILVSPSWGKETLLSKYGVDLLLPLAQSGFNIIIRPHPQSFISPAERANIEQLQNVLSNFSNVSWDRDTSNVYAFAKADLMISDFSSVIFDFVCLEGKPVISIDNDMDLSGYDMADIPREDIWTFKALEKVGGRIKPADFPHIKALCEKALQERANLAQIKELLWRYPHEAGRVCALELIKIEREMIENKLKAHSLSIARLRELERMLNRGYQKVNVC